jgi:hypothetical protein
MLRLLQWAGVLGCSHARTTFPMTPRGNDSKSDRPGTYVVCLDCGREFAYDWKTMSLGEPIKVGAPRASELDVKESVGQEI